MSLNSTVSAERVHIGFFGMRNAGKSSVVNAVTGQKISLVSDIKGTTTDPVKKAMELLPLGPVVIIDTPGIDDEGLLGEMRVKRAKDMLNRTDIALLVVDATKGIQPADKKLKKLFESKKIPYIVIFNKSDLLESIPENSENEIYVSAQKGTNINLLKEMIARTLKTKEDEKKIVSDLVEPNDLVVLVVPIDESAPKGRLILPQQQTIRDILDAGAVPVVVKDTELEAALEKLQTKPRLVITDSQAFGKVAKIVPSDVPLTSFSILMARYNGDLRTVVNGAAALDELENGDIVLISEGCTHHRQCEDIGTVKIPRWLKEHTSKDIQLEFTSGTEFPDDLSRYKAIIHCGGCMLNEREMKYRLKCAEDGGVPMTNYGTAIAHMKGILKRSVAPFAKELMGE